LATDNGHDRLISFRLPTDASEFLDKLATSVDSTKTALLRSIFYAAANKISSSKTAPLTLGEVEQLVKGT